jgi:hypothetical protein
MAWVFYIRNNTFGASNYELDKRFGGGQNRWSAYSNGSQPNDQLLNSVEEEIEGSKNIYLCGPHKEKLWSAICSADINELKLIEEMGRSVDRLIANFRLRVIDNKISIDYDECNRCYTPKNKSGMHPFDQEIADIEFLIEELLGSYLAAFAADILRAEIKPYQDEVEANARTDWYDDIVCNPYTRTVVQQMMREESYSSIQMGTVKNKGTKTIGNTFQMRKQLKLRASVPPTAPAP